MLIGTVLWSLFEVVFALTPTYYWGLGILVLTGMAHVAPLPLCLCVACYRARQPRKWARR